MDFRNRNTRHNICLCCAMFLALLNLYARFIVRFWLLSFGCWIKNELLQHAYAYTRTHTCYLLHCFHYCGIFFRITHNFISCMATFLFQLDGRHWGKHYCIRFLFCIYFDATVGHFKLLNHTAQRFIILEITVLLVRHFDCAHYLIEVWHGKYALSANIIQ